MNDIALVLCTYNKKQDTLNCIDSIFKSNINNFDLIVVDNASSDGISDEIKKLYPEKITLIISDTNNGAGAGFNIGIKYALNHDYTYIMTVDHDVLFMEDTIKILYDFLNQNEDVGMAGSKFCHMDRPNTIQWLGGKIEFEDFRKVADYTDVMDDDKIPEIRYCDHTILGASMVRAVALPKVGLLDESYFIYNEDTDWGLRCKKAGYKVAICSKSKVLHRFGMSVSSQINTSATYYYRRNIFAVMIKYMPEHFVEKYCDYALNNVFQGLYSCNKNKKYNAMQTLFLSLQDALNNETGKAKEGRIFELDKSENKFRAMVSKNENIVLVAAESLEENVLGMKRMIKQIKKFNPNAVVYIRDDDHEIASQIPEIRLISQQETEGRQNLLVLNFCHHVFSFKDFNRQSIYTDRYLNVVSGDDDIDYCLKYEENYEFFKNIHYPSMLLRVKALREEARLMSNK